MKGCPKRKAEKERQEEQKLDRELKNKTIIISDSTLRRGRILTLKCESKAEPGTIYNLVGFYGHTSNIAASLRQDTVNALKDALSMTHTNILMGDFNFVEDSLDRNGKLPNNLEKDRQVLFDWNKITTDFDLVDTFRILNPLSRRYSFTHQNKKSRSRIDRIYVTDKESGKIMRQGFIDTPWRDHKIITVEMNETSERGPGQWVLNTDLLKDQKFLEEVEDQWKYFAQAKDKFASKLAWWGRAKAMVKTIAMIYSIHKKQIESDLEKLLSNERLRLESLLDQKYSEQTERELECILKRQKELLLKKSEGYCIRARIPNFEENEQTFHIAPEWRK